MKSFLLCVGVALALSACRSETRPQKEQSVVAAPDASTQKFPTDLRRTSLIVSDIDESLKLYRDVLGFQVNYDAEVTMSGVALPAGVPGATISAGKHE